MNTLIKQDYLLTLNLNGWWNQIKIIANQKINEIMVQTIYEIVKAHGGELKVETKEGEGSTFIIQLPT